MVQIVWFKRDLRTVDHGPLFTAASRGPILPLYIVEPDYWRQRDVSHRQWIGVSTAIRELDQRLRELGAPLILRVGNTVDVLRQLHTDQRISALFAHEETGNDFTFQRDIAVRDFCRTAQIPFYETRQFGVFRGLINRDQWASLHRKQMSEKIIAEPANLQLIHGIKTELMPSASNLSLLPDGCTSPQPGTRSDASSHMNSFFNGRGANYRRAMSTPLEGAEACSRLSVAISTGSVSIKEVLQRCYRERKILSDIPPHARSVPLTAIDSLVARLHWHCHFIQKLESQPTLEWKSQHAVHEANRATTHADDPLLNAWATGKTGLPFVDACMRSLIATGWLNFRMRAMVQSVASYHFNLDWRATGIRLARLFTDYEPGIHWSQVQMQAGQAGINVPRIYNPVKQGMDQDPQGIFTRKWVQELTEVPLEFLQQPWKMDLDLQTHCGCVLGVNYPAPVVDHVESARRARERLTLVRKSAGYGIEAKRVFQQHGSRKRQATRRKLIDKEKLADKKNIEKFQLTLDF